MVVISYDVSIQRRLKLAKEDPGRSQKLAQLPQSKNSASVVHFVASW